MKEEKAGKKSNVTQVGGVHNMTLPKSPPPRGDTGAGDIAETGEDEVGSGDDGAVKDAGADSDSEEEDAALAVDPAETEEEDADLLSGGRPLANQTIEEPEEGNVATSWFGGLFDRSTKTANSTEKGNDTDSAESASQPEDDESVAPTSANNDTDRDTEESTTETSEDDSESLLSVNATATTNSSLSYNHSAASPAYMADDTSDRYNVSLLLIGNGFLASHDMPSTLLPSLFHAAGLTVHIDCALNSSFPLVSSDSTRPSHSSTGSSTRHILSTHMYHHIVVQDSLTHPFFHNLQSAYTEALVDLWNVTCPMARLHLLETPLPCHTPSVGCLHDADEGEVDWDWEQMPLTYSDALSQFTRVWFDGAESDMKAAMGAKKANYSSRVDILPLAEAFEPVGEDDDIDEAWLTSLYSTADEDEGQAADEVLSLKGSYLTACMIFAQTTGRSPVGAAAPEMLMEAEVEEEEVLAIQRRAAEAVNAWWVSTESDRQLVALNGSALAVSRVASVETTKASTIPAALPTVNVTVSAGNKTAVNASAAAVAPVSAPESGDEDDRAAPKGSADDYNEAEHEEQMRIKREEAEWNDKEDKRKANEAKAKVDDKKTARAPSDPHPKSPFTDDDTPLHPHESDLVDDEFDPDHEQTTPVSAPKSPPLSTRFPPKQQTQPKPAEKKTEEEETVGGGSPTLSERVQALPALTLLYAVLTVVACGGAYWLYSCVRAQWTQKQLRKRRGYDEGELGDFPKESTAGYAFDDGL